MSTDHRSLRTLDHLGHAHCLQIDETGAIKGAGDILAMEPLPNGPFSEIAPFVESLLNHDMAFLFHVVGVDGGVALVHLVEPSDPSECPFERRGEHIGGAFVGANPISLIIEDPKIAAGTLLLAAGLHIGAQGPAPLIHRADEVIVLRHAMTAAQVAEWFPQLRPRPGFDLPKPHYPVARWAEYRVAIDYAHAHCQPNRLLLVSWLDGPAWLKRTYCKVLGTEGVTFFAASDLEPWFDGSRPPGFWVLDDAAWTQSIEDDQVYTDVGGNWRRADPEDLQHFGWTPEQLDAEISTLSGNAHQPGLTFDMLALRHQTPRSAPVAPRFSGGRAHRHRSD